jgi:hypothetical protein
MISDLKEEKRIERSSTDDNGNQEPKERAALCKVTDERYSFVCQAS